MAKNGHGFNGKRRRFVEEYIKDLNATQAAIRAGYSEKTAGQQGFRLLKNVQIAKAIAKAHVKRSERVEVTQDFVLTGLIENYARAMKDIPVCDREGNIYEYRYEGSVANRALELLGRQLAMFTDVKKIEGDLPPMQIILTEDEADDV